MPALSKNCKPGKSKKRHVSTVNIADTTVKRYFNGINKVSEWRKERQIKPPRDLDESYDQLGEYVNDLYQHDMPRYLAGDAIAG